MAPSDHPVDDCAAANEAVFAPSAPIYNVAAAAETGPGTSTTSLLESALAYARHGWCVFPCHSVTDAGCTCGDSGCKSPGKHPLTRGGFHSATTDAGTIRAWWGEWEWANIAIATGKGLIVLDVDDVRSAESWPHAMRALLGANTAIARTGRAGGDGRHIYLRSDADIGSRAGVWPGVDVRGAGGYVIAPPSTHASGNFYVWLKDPSYELAALPDELLPELERTARNKRARETPGSLLSSEQVAKIRSALCCLSAEPRDKWLRMGMALHSTGAGEQAFALWDEWSRTCPEKYDPAVQRRTWEGFDEGLPDGNGVTIRSLFGAAYSAGWRGGTSAHDARAPAQPTPGLALRVDDLFALPDREPDWLVEDLLAGGECAVLFGPSASGKTFVVLDMCARIVHGFPLWGLETRKAHVLYLPGEGRLGLRRRLVAWSSDQPDLPPRHNLHVAESLPNLATEDGSLRVYATLQRARDEGTPYGLVVIDTLAWAMPGVDENSAQEVGAVMVRIRRLRDEFGAAVLIVHHASKGNQAGMGGMRGSSAIASNIETVLRVGRTGKDTVRITVEKVKEATSGYTIECELVPLELGRRQNGKPIGSAFLRERKNRNALESDLVVLMRHLVSFGDATPSWSVRDLEGDVRPESLGRDKVRGLVAVAISHRFLQVERGERRALLHRCTPEAFARFCPDRVCGNQVSVRGEPAHSNGAAHSVEVRGERQEGK